MPVVVSTAGAPGLAPKSISFSIVTPEKGSEYLPAARETPSPSPASASASAILQGATFVQGWASSSVGTRSTCCRPPPQAAPAGQAQPRMLLRRAPPEQPLPPLLQELTQRLPHALGQGAARARSRSERKAPPVGPGPRSRRRSWRRRRRPRRAAPRPGAVDHVDDDLARGEAVGAQRQLLEGVLPLESDGGRVDDQLVAGHVRVGGRAPPELLAEVEGAQPGPVPDLDLGASRTSAQTTARAAPPAPSTNALLPPGSRGAPSRNPSASVLSAWTSPSAKLRVLAAPISRAVSERVSATASAAPLWGTVTLAPAKPRSGMPLTRRSNSSGATSIAS